MADNMFEEGVQWFSAKLRILEADYEKSKLQVLQDTLLCKRSMIELELLCKNEQLRKNTRVNNRIKESEFELQEQLKSLSVDLESATNQLQTVQNTLQDEKTQHNLEKKELEEKLSLEMEKRMEEQKKNAGHREKLLQEEIKNLQDEQVKTFREAEDLRMELRRKNVPVKAKAVQTQVTVKHASTMAQVDSQTSDVGLQAQSAAGELPPMNSENGQGTDEAVHENIESGKGGKEVAGLTGRNKKRKATDGDQEKGLKNTNEEVKKKKKEADKGKESEGIVGEKTKNERKSSSTRREITTSPSKVTDEAGKQNRLCDRTTIGDPFLSFSASQEDGVSLQYNKTPRLRKKSDESDLSLENNRQKSNVNNVLLDNTPALNTESVAAKKQSEGMSEGMRKVCFENGSNHTSKGKEEEEGRETGFDEEAGKKYSALRTSLHQQIVEEQQSQVQKEDSMEDREEGTCKTKMAGTGKEVQNKESKRTAKEKKRTMKENPEYSRANKTKEVEAAEDEILRDKNPTEKEKSVKRIEDQNSENRRVLRSRTKKRNSGVEISPCKGQGDDVNRNKSFAKNSRQIPHDIDGISAAKKCKTDDTWSKGHEPAMLLTSSPEDHQFPRKTELSSSEIDTLVDETHPSPGAKTRATSDDTSQQPETEIQESERVRDYNSCRGSLVVDDNRIKEVGGKINSESLHSAMERVKSKKCPCEENDTVTSNREEKIEQKTELFSKKCRKSKRTLKKGGYGNDACTSRRQDSSAFFTDNDTRSTRQKNKSTTSHRGHSRRKEQKHTGQPAIALEKTDATLKENAPSEKSAGKKRKPNQCVHEVPAPADLQSSPDGTTSTESSSVLDNTKKRKTLFNARENSLMVSASKVQISFTNTTLSKGRTNTGIPPSLSAFMRSFIAPKLKKSF